MTGNDDTGRSGRRRRCSPPTAQSSARRSPRPASRRTSSGYLGTSDGWTDLATDHRMDWTYDAAPPRQRRADRPDQADRAARRQHAHARARLRAAPRARRRRRRAASLRARLRRRRGGATRRAGTRYLGRSSRCRRSAAALAHRVPRLGDGARGLRGQDLPRRLRRRARPALGLGELLQHLRRLPRGLVARPLPDRDRPARRSATAAAARRALDYLWTVQQRPDGSFPQNSPARRRAGLRRPADGRGGRSRSCSPASSAAPARPTGRTCSRSADFVVAQRAEHRRRSAGRTRPATRRRRSPRRSPAWSCAADIAREQRRRARGRRATWRRPTSGSAPRAAGPRPPTARSAARRTTCGSPTNGDADAGDQIQISDGGPLIDQRAVVDPSFLELVRLGVQVAPTTRTIRSTAAGRRRRAAATTTPNGPFWHRASFDGYGEKRDGGQWEPTPTRARA